ncbi:hypothetical protein RvY_07269 [Ramazzottius varieornatus]|uniref:Lipase domain-containing protein n=1 Tax=Ramazzottius varieornatus TaxID=947166 RepID=A0A1D1VAZ2_RAMVA|nr:hypothetical protein RvY_07269 [Ramazzottius varieornatus]
MGTGAHTGVQNDVLGCSHYRASLLFIETVINPACGMVAVRCGTYAEFRSGQCFSCETSDCQTMGLNLRNKSEAQRGNYYLLTGSSAPYCVQTFRIELTFSSVAKTTERGYLKVQLQYESGEEGGWEPLNPEALDFRAGEKIFLVFAGAWNLGGLEKVKAVKLTWTFDYSWRRPFDWLRSHELHIELTIQLEELSNRNPAQFRTADGKLDEKDTAVFARV